MKLLINLLLLISVSSCGDNSIFRNYHFELADSSHKYKEIANEISDNATLFTGKDNHKHDSLVIIANDYWNKGDSFWALYKHTEFKKQQPEPLWENKKADKFDTLKLVIDYYDKYNEFKSKKDQMEIKYLRTGNEKYRTIGNRYYDSVNKYIKLSKQINP